MVEYTCRERSQRRCELGRLPGGGNGNTLQNSCLENSMDRGACGTTVHGIAKVWHFWATEDTYVIKTFLRLSSLVCCVATIQKSFAGVIVCFLLLEVKLLTCVQLFVTPWAIAYQVPPSMGFSRQEYWSGLPFSSTYTLLKTLSTTDIIHLIWNDSLL